MDVATGQVTSFMPVMDAALADLTKGKDVWAQTSISKRIQVLAEVKDALLAVCASWAALAAENKHLPAGSPLVGEEWISGPYAVMATCNELMATLGRMEGKTFLGNLKKRQTTTGQLAVRVLPNTIWDKLVFSGIKAEVWMEKGVSKQNLAAHTASAYDIPPEERQGKVALVLGAGNIAAIAPLDCFHKLFLEHSVVLLKMSPVNDYLTDVLRAALKPLIDRNAIRIVKGGGDVGAYLADHPEVEELHITGASGSHDAIIWGPGDEGKANKAAGTPKNNRRITSELGAVCPTIVVPGPWSAADIKFQAEHIATQKMHNSGFNCIACQTLILPQSWDKSEALMAAVTAFIAGATRLPYYPGAGDRLEAFAGDRDNVVPIHRQGSPAALVADLNASKDRYHHETEVFAPALGVYRINEADPALYLEQAIAYANDNLHGTLGGNILIHPATIDKIGKKRFEALIADLKYGSIAINAWTGMIFLMTQCPWGAFPGHTLDDVQSGIGFVHNTYMFDRPERVVISAPWRPFPRTLLSGGTTLFPKPPWFITNKKQHKLAMHLTRFQHAPSLLKLPRIFFHALTG